MQSSLNGKNILNTPIFRVPLIAELDFDGVQMTFWLMNLLHVINFDQEQIPMCFMLDIREFSLQYCKELNCLLLNKKCRIWSY